MFLRSAILLAVVTSSLSALPVFIGTATGNNSGSKGIYFAEFDPQAGTLTQPKLAAEYTNPGFLAQHPGKAVLLAVGVPNKPFADGSSSVASFAIDGEHRLSFLGEASTGGTDACHLAVDHSGRAVAVANYGDGNISIIRLDENAVPKDIISLVTNHGTGPNEVRQDGPHAHGVYFDKDNTHLFVPDLGRDQVLIYPFEQTTSKLGDPLPSVGTAPGAGPRHMVFTPVGNHAYVVNELNNTVLVISCQFGDFKPLATVSTLPKDFKGDNTTAEIAISRDSRFVYASNRGHDSIAVFRRDLTYGTLTLIQNAPCGGKSPRHFTIAPGAKWLLCAHQDSNTISTLPLNPETGELGPPANTVPCPSPICILFER